MLESRIRNAFVSGYLDTTIKGKRFFIDKQGILHSIEIENAEIHGILRDGLIKAQDTKTKKIGYVNINSEWVIPPSFISARSFASGYAWVYDETGYYFIDTKGKKVFNNNQKQYDLDDSFSNGMLQITDKETGLKGYMDSHFQIVISCKYKTAWSFKDGIALVTYNRDEMVYIDKKGIEPFSMLEVIQQ